MMPAMRTGSVPVPLAPIPPPQGEGGSARAERQRRATRSRVGSSALRMNPTRLARERALGLIIEACMLATNLFMLWYGLNLVRVTWYQTVAEFPLVPVGVTYLPVPIGGAITVLFVIERLMTGVFFKEPDSETLSGVST